MVSLEVHVEELLLAEGFITMATGIRLFSSMGPFVHDHVPLLAQTGKMETHVNGYGKVNFQLKRGQNFMVNSRKRMIPQQCKNILIDGLFSPSYSHPTWTYSLVKGYIKVMN